MVTPRIYVASLSDYNSGILHGKWIDASQDADAINEEIQSMLKESKQDNAEEYAIHDFEGFGAYSVSESEDIETIAALAKALDEHGELILALMSHMGFKDVDEAVGYHEDNYQGEHKSLADWAESFLEDTGTLNEIPENLRRYFDFESYARDAELGGDVFTIELDGDTHVYWSR